MNNQQKLADTNAQTLRTNDLVGGSVLLVAALLFVFAMLHHPTAHAHSLEEFANELHSIRFLNQLVHGGGIALVVMLLLGFSCLSTALGWIKPAVRAGAIAHTLGALAMVVAAMVSGFIVPSYLEGFVAGTSDENSTKEVLSMLRTVNQTADQLGVLAMSIGVLMWSLAILNRKNRYYFTGVLGVATGVAGIVGLFTGHLSATVHGVILFALLQAIWTIAVAIQMLKHRFTFDEE